MIPFRPNLCCRIEICLDTPQSIGEVHYQGQGTSWTYGKTRMEIQNIHTTLCPKAQQSCFWLIGFDTSQVPVKRVCLSANLSEGNRTPQSCEQSQDWE